MTDADDGFMRDSEIALMDTLKTVFEIMVAKSLVKPETIGKMLQGQIDQYAAKETMPRAVFVMEQLRDCVTDPQRARFRRLADQKPEGSA